MLILALLGARQGDELSRDGAPSIIYAELVKLDNDGDTDGGRVPDTQVLATEPLPARRTAAKLLSELQEPARAPPEPRADAETADPERAALASVAPREPSVEDLLRIQPLEPSLDPTIVVSDTGALAFEPSAEPEAQSEHETEEIPREQRRMLDRKVSEWSALLNELSDAEIAWTHQGQAYSATVTRFATEDSMGIEHVVVAVSTEQDGSRWSTEMHFKRLAFSSFAQLVDRWDPRVMIHDDEIDGRFHSNTEILIANSRGVKPAFYGKVTTADGVNTSGSARPVRHSDVFLGGLETRVKRISLPKRFLPFPAELDVDAARLQRFDADARITFYADGSYGWKDVEPSEPEQRVMLSDEPHFLIASDKVDIYVRGIVNGKVLVYAPEDIVIEDDLIYAEHPARFPDSDDYLGLVADRNVVIADPETTGPGDLTVHAAIYAKRRFAVSRYTAGEHATLRMYGSVSAGSISATEPRFRTEVAFDKRLEKSRPPGFPMTDRYEVIAWDGRWAAETQP